MYADREDKIRIALQQLDLIQPLLNQEQATVAEARQRMYQDQQMALQEQKESQKQNISLAMEFGVQTPYARRNGEWFQASNGMPFTSPEHFQQVTGITLEEAEARRLVTDLNPQVLQERAIVAGLASEYIDSGITLNDSLATAQAKVRASAIYQDAVRPPARGGGGGGGGGPRSSSGSTLKATADTAGEIRTWLLANKRANPDMPYHEIWGQLADQLRAEGLNPENYDPVFWEILHPEGKEGYQKYKKQSSSSGGGVGFEDI